MKTHHAVITIILAGSFYVSAQEPAAPTPRRAVVNSGGTDSESPAGALSTNYQITIAGSLGKTDPIDVTLRGSSRIFSASLQNPIRKIEVKLMSEKDSLSVVYSIGAQIAVKAGENAVQYRDASVTGSFLATLGQPFPVLEIGDSKLTIQVDQLPEKK